MHEKGMRIFEETSESEQSSERSGNINAFVLSKDYSSNCVEFFIDSFSHFYTKNILFIFTCKDI
jgi:hypothetical protein